MRRRRQRYETLGLPGLLDRRTGRRQPVRTDKRVVDALKRVIEEASDASSSTASYLLWRVERILAAEYGAGAVAMPSQATFYRLFDRYAHGQHTTGSARTRRSMAVKPDFPYGVFTALRPGELMQIDFSPHGGYAYRHPPPEPRTNGCGYSSPAGPLLPTDRLRLRRRRERPGLVQPLRTPRGLVESAAIDRGENPASVQRWCQFAPAIAAWTQILGRSAPEPTEPNAAGNYRLSARFVEWMMGLPDGYVTATSGVSRSAAMRLLGTASCLSRPPWRCGCCSTPGCGGEAAGGAADLRRSQPLCGNLA